MRAAIIGYGCIAHGDCGGRTLPLYHLDAYRALRRRVSLVAVADTRRKNLEMARRTIPSVQLYDNAEEMLVRERPDIVSICTPDDMHTQHIEMAARIGIKGIWCEKPIATDALQVARLKQILPDLPAIQVNYWRRFVPEIRDLRKRIQSREFGKINRMFGYYPDGWMRNGSHLIDLFIYFSGITNVFCRFNHSLDGDGQVFAAGLAPGDIIWAAMPVPRDRYNLFEFDVLCQRARVRITENGRSIEIAKDRKDTAFNHLRILRPVPKRTACGWRRAFRLALENLLDCVEKQNQQTISPVSNALVIAESMINLHDQSIGSGTYLAGK